MPLRPKLDGLGRRVAIPTENQEPGGTSESEGAMAIFEGPDRNRNIMIAVAVVVIAVIIYFYAAGHL